MLIKAVKRFCFVMIFALCMQPFLAAVSAKADTAAEPKNYDDMEAAVTKKDLIILLEKLSGNLESDIADIKDTKNADDEYIKKAVNELKELGVIDEHVSFDNLSENLKKEEYYYIVARYIGIEVAEGKTLFNDDESIKAWAKPYIKGLEELGLLDVSKDLNPDKELNRGELRSLLKSTFLVIINNNQSFRADDENKSNAFIVVNTSDAAVDNIKTQNPILINQRAGNGRLRIINSDISRVYIAKKTKNFEVQLSNSKLKSAKSLGENISYTNVGADGRISPLPNPEEYKPAQRKIVTKVIRSSRTGGSSGSSSGSDLKNPGKSTDEGDKKDKDNKGNLGKGSDGKAGEENNPKKDDSKSLEKPPQDNNSENQKDKDKKTPENNNPEGNDEDKALENASRDFLVLNDRLYTDAALRYKAADGVNLEEEALIGLSSSGENNGTKLKINWEGKNLEKVKSAKTGEYELAASTLQELIINGKNYGKVKILVKIIIE